MHFYRSKKSETLGDINNGRKVEPRKTLKEALENLNKTLNYDIHCKPVPPRDGS